jgi:hypothetical protein
MANRMTLLGDGVGSPKVVSDCILTELSKESIEGEYVITLNSSMTALMQDATLRHAALAIVCSHLNAEFATTNAVYRVTDKDQIDRQYVLSGTERDIIGAMLAD